MQASVFVLFFSSTLGGDFVACIRWIFQIFTLGAVAHSMRWRAPLYCFTESWIGSTSSTHLAFGLQFVLEVLKWVYTTDVQYTYKLYSFINPYLVG